MSYLQNLELSWTDWKELQADTSAKVYYLKNDLQYVPFYIAPNSNTFPDAEALYYVNVNRDPSSVSGPYAALASGTKSSKHIQSITYTAVNYGAVAARGEATVSGFSSLSGATLTVNGIVLTEGIQWTAATSNNATAISLANAITTATATTHATGSAQGAVVTIIANTAGAAGNAISLASSDGTHLPVSGAFLTGGANGINGDSITIQYVSDASVVGKEYVTVSGSAITVHIVSGSSTAQQVQAAVNGWNAYTGLAIYNSAASSFLVSAVIDPGQEATPQTTQGPTNLTGGVTPVTVLSDWEITYKPSATLTTSFANGIADSLV